MVLTCNSSAISPARYAIEDDKQQQQQRKWLGNISEPV
jgi:hypothetical protein